MEALQSLNQTVAGKIRQYVALQENGERLFLLAFFVYVIVASLQTTTFRINESAVIVIKLAVTGCVLFKIIAFDSYSAKELYLAAWLLGDAVAVRVFSSYEEVFYFVVLLLGAKNIAFDKILKVYLLVSAAVLLSAFIASRLDIIEDLVYVRAFLVERNSFGTVYPTDFAAHIFFFLSAGYYVIRKKLQTYHILLGAIICAIVYYYCKTRLDCITIVILLFGLWIIQGKDNGFTTIGYRKKFFGFLQKKAPWFGIAGFTAMYLLSWFYVPNVPIFRFIDELLSGRLRLGNQGLQEYGFSFFGQHVAMSGNGGSVVAPVNYFFIDSSYLLVYLCYGAVFLAIILFIHFSCCKKYADDRYYLLILSVIVINCMIAHHMIDLAYNPFYLALLAKKEAT